MKIRETCQELFVNSLDTVFAAKQSIQRLTTGVITSDFTGRPIHFGHGKKLRMFECLYLKRCLLIKCLNIRCIHIFSRLRSARGKSLNLNDINMKHRIVTISSREPQRDAT